MLDTQCSLPMTQCIRAAAALLTTGLFEPQEVHTLLSYCYEHTLDQSRTNATVSQQQRTQGQCRSRGGTCLRPLVDAAQRPRRLNRVELAQFHSEDYVEFLEKVCPERLEVSPCRPGHYKVAICRLARPTTEGGKP